MTNVERVVLSDGQLGTDETVEKMAFLAMGEYGAGNPVIRDKTIALIRANRVPERNKFAEMAVVHHFVQTHLRYVRDPLGFELLTAPDDLLKTRHDGDCDDHCILEAAMLGSIGIPTSFIVYGFDGKGFSHVAMAAQIDGEWIPLDPIKKDQGPGWVAPYTSRKIYPVNSRRGFPKTPSLTRTIGLAMTLAGLYSGYKRVVGRFL